MSSKTDAPGAGPADWSVGWWGIGALTAVALVARVISLNNGLWVDEIYSLVESFRPPLLQVVTTFPGDTQHPLYALLANGAEKLLGDARWVIRLPAMLFGAATVPALFYFGRRVTSQREAFLAALLLAVSYHHVWFSQNARGYSMLAFWTVTTSLLFWDALLRPRTRAAVGYAVLAALGAYTHLTMVFVVVSHSIVGGAWAVTRPQDRQRWIRWCLLAFGLSALLTVALYGPVLGQLLDFFLHRPSRLQGISSPGWALAEAVRVLKTGLGAAPGLVAGAVVAALGTASYWRTNRWALALFVVPGVVTILGALAVRGTMYPRFFFSLIGFALLIGVRGAAVLALAIARRVHAPERYATLAGRWVTGVVGLMIVLSATSLAYNYCWPKQDFIGAADWIATNVPPGDAIVTAGVTVFPYREYVPRPWPEIPEGGESLIDEMRATRRVWVVYVFPRYLEISHPYLTRLIREECGREVRFRGSLGGGDIVVCPLSATGSGATAATQPVGSA